jgi:acyl carrier protein
MGSIAKAVTEFIEGNMEMNAWPETMTPATDLRELGFFDSLSVLKLLVFLEKRFAIRFESDDLAESDFVSVASIERLVESKLAQSKMDVGT